MNSYVTLVARKCPICGATFETGELLIDRRLREVFEKQTIVGFGVCPECHKNVDDGFVALVEAEEVGEDGIRATGRTAWMKRTSLPKALGDESENIPEMAFVSTDVFVNTLESLVDLGHGFIVHREEK